MRDLFVGFLPPETLWLRRCRHCGCTDDHACVHPTLGPCWWVDADVCSHCRPPANSQFRCAEVRRVA